MLIKQISVFIENMPGKLGEVTQVLGENGIDMVPSPWRTPRILGFSVSLSTTRTRPVKCSETTISL